MDSAPTVSVGGTIYALPNSDVALNATVTDPDGGIDTPGYRWVQTAGGAVTINNGSTTNADFVTGGLGTSYTFQFTADDGVLGNSASITVNVPDVPAAPGGLTDSGDTNNDGTYTVAWNAVTDTGTTITYHLEEAAGTSSGPTGSWSEIYAGSTASTTVSHPGNGAYYYWYRVRAEAKISGTSLGFSNYSGTPDRIHLVVTPGAPSGIFPTVASTSTGSYNITWGARTGVVVLSKVFYELQEDTATGWPSPATVYSGTALIKSFSKTDLADYYYRVRACNQDGNVKVCSDWTGRAHEIITGTGGGGQQQQQIQAPTSDGTAAPAPATGGIGMEKRGQSPFFDSLVIRCGNGWVRDAAEA